MSNVLGARLTHAYTATGAVFGLLALVAAAEHRVYDMFVWLAIACAVDATDGTLARYFDVFTNTPRFDGRKLDDIVDYLTYVVVPMFFVVMERLVTGWGVIACAAALLASAYAFSKRDEPGAKASFTGFPSYWNIVVLYLYLLRVPPTPFAVILLVLAALVFTPVVYVNPVLPPVWRIPNFALLAVWLVTIAIIFMKFDATDRRVLYVSLIFPLFHGLVSHYVHLHRRHKDGGGGLS